MAQDTAGSGSDNQPSREHALKRKRKRPSKTKTIEEIRTHSTSSAHDDGDNNKETDDQKKNMARSLLYTDTTSDDEDEKSKARKQLPKSKPATNRVWCEEDEISILKGIIKFKKEKDVDPRKNMAAFHGFVIGSLILQATRIQLSEKVRYLNEKYIRGVQPKTQHEAKVFKLSQQIWAVNPTEPHNLGDNGPSEQQKDVDVSSLRSTSQQNVAGSAQQNIPDTVRVKQENVFIRGPGMDVQALQAFNSRITKDVELVLNAMAHSHGNANQIGMSLMDLTCQSFGLVVKYGNLVLEKAKSPEMRDSPELLEKEMVRAYLEAKKEHATLISNAYTTFTKDLGDAA